MKITSSVFEHEGMIPSIYTCDGEGINPPLHISEIPQQAQSLVLIVDDPDIPPAIKQRLGIEVFDHWVVYNIVPIKPESSSGLPDNALPWNGVVAIEENSTPGTIGANSRNNKVYGPPCPPPEYEPSTHRYFFKVYALDSLLDLSDGANKTQVEKAMQGHILDKSELVGKYSRKELSQ